MNTSSRSDTLTKRPLVKARHRELPTKDESGQAKYFGMMIWRCGIFDCSLSKSQHALFLFLVSPVGFTDFGLLDMADSLTMIATTLASLCSLFPSSSKTTIRYPYPFCTTIPYNCAATHMYMAHAACTSAIVLFLHRFRSHSITVSLKHCRYRKSILDLCHFIVVIKERDPVSLEMQKFSIQGHCLGNAPISLTTRLENEVSSVTERTPTPRPSYHTPRHSLVIGSYVSSVQSFVTTNTPIQDGQVWSGVYHNDVVLYSAIPIHKMFPIADRAVDSFLSFHHGQLQGSISSNPRAQHPKPDPCRKKSTVRCPFVPLRWPSTHLPQL